MQTIRLYVRYVLPLSILFSLQAGDRDAPQAGKRVLVMTASPDGAGMATAISPRIVRALVHGVCRRQGTTGDRW
jgi:hypothetical protein